jgi:hypothetical protein
MAKEEEVSSLKKEFEEKVYYLGKRFAEVEAQMLQRFEEIQKRNLVQDGFIQTFNFSLSEETKFRNKERKEIQESQNRLEKTLDRQAKEGSQLDKRISSSENATSLIYSILAEHKKEIEEALKNARLVPEIKEKLQSLDESGQKQSSFLKDSIKDGQSKFESISSLIKKIEYSIENNRKDISFLQEKCKHTLDAIDKFRFVFDRFSSESVGEMQLLKQSVSELIKDSISKVKIPSTDTFASKQSLEEIKSLLESLKLDSQNAFLKANNCEMQNNLFEKKIQNLQLILKQKELGEKQ